MKKIVFLTIALVFLGGSLVLANVNQIKAYKEAFPDAKPKCINCHVDAIPKKDEGKHDWNAYGKAVKEAAQKAAVDAAKATPTAETYKTVGPVENFKEEKK